MSHNSDDNDRAERQIMFRVELSDVTSEAQAEAFLAELPWADINDDHMANEYIGARLADAIANIEEFRLQGHIMPRRGNPPTMLHVVETVEAYVTLARQREEERVANNIVREREAAERAVVTHRLETERREARYEEAAELVAGLQDHEVAQDVIVQVLRGHEPSLNAAAKTVRQAARAREARNFAPPNSHGRVFELLRRSNIPGSDAALNFADNWVGALQASPDTERQAEAAAEVRSLINDAQAGQAASSRSLLEALGLSPEVSPEVPRLGRPVDATSDNGMAALTALHGINEESARALQRAAASSVEQSQHSAQYEFTLATRELMNSYGGDVAFVLDRFIAGMTTYGTGVRDFTTVRAVLAEELQKAAEELLT